MLPGQESIVIELLWELSRVLRACQHENICGEGITFQQFRILDGIACGRAGRMSDLSGLLDVDKSTVTRLLEPLVRRGLVSKERSPHDPRTCLLSLTRAGQEVYLRARDCLQDFGARVEQAIPEKDRKQVVLAVKEFLQAVNSACYMGKCCQKAGGVWIGE